MSDIGIVLSNPIRAKIFKAICEGKDVENFAKRARMPLILVKRELSFLEEKELIVNKEGKYVPTEKGIKVYESIEW